MTPLQAFSKQHTDPDAGFARALAAQASAASLATAQLKTRVLDWSLRSDIPLDAHKELMEILRG